MPVQRTNTWQSRLLVTTALVACECLVATGLHAQGLGAALAPGTAAAPAAPAAAAVATPQAAPAAPANATPQAAPAAPVAAVPQAAPAVAAVAAQPVAAPVILDHARVVDTSKLQYGETTVSLYGITGMDGEPAQGLQAFIGSGKVTCQPQAGSGFVCLMADGTDIAQVALINGAATATPNAPVAYHEQEAAAQAARRGVWASLPPPPETVLHPLVRDTATLATAGKIYPLAGIIGFQAPYAAQLQGYIAANGDSATCAPQNDASHYVCLLQDGTDIAKVALVNGAARVAPDAPDAYRTQQLDALNHRRGYWATASETVMTAALLPPAPVEQYTLVAGDDGVDGITYVGGVPTAVIDGESVFLVLGGGVLGWGYYDHFHHWHGAPDRFRHHMEHFHPDGHGLRAYNNFHHDPARFGREEAMRHDPARPGIGHPAIGARGETPHAGVPRPGVGAPMTHPGAMAMAHQGAPANGFLRPNPAAATHAAAPAPHQAAASSARHK